MTSDFHRSSFISVSSQAARLSERRMADRLIKTCHGIEVIVLPGVYGTSIDSELMIDTVGISKDETFLEVGVGTGIVSIALAQKAKSGVGVDINRRAIDNSRENALTAGVTNISFQPSDVFETVKGQFDVVVCNPPYGNQPVKDEIDRMFWDPNNEMKKKFFHEVNHYLHPNGRIYFGWANFADIDVDLPMRLAAQNGFQIVRTIARDAGNGQFQFIVHEIQRVAPKCSSSPSVHTV